MVGCSGKPVEPPSVGNSTTQPAMPAKQTAETSEEKARKEMVENIDGPIDDFFKANQGLPITDALDWVKHNQQNFPGGVTLESMLTGLSDAGAKKINVISNLFCDYLIVVTLPTEPLLRQKVFASDSQVREVLHLEKTKDFGQKYLAYPFGSNPVMIMPQSRTTAEAKAKDAAMSMNAGCENLLKAYLGVPPDARDWAKRNPKIFPGGVTLEAMLTNLSDAGAQAIVVFTNVPSYDYLIVLTLPSEAATRQKVFTSDARLREVCGLEPTKDYGQKYLGYPFSSKR